MFCGFLPFLFALAFAIYEAKVYSWDLLSVGSSWHNYVCLVRILQERFSNIVLLNLLIQHPELCRVYS
ncbi:hypothetical protein SDJN02_06749, partial [Cucurbita argyrosperma subsp. argyrosperma]